MRFLYSLTNILIKRKMCYFCCYCICTVGYLVPLLAACLRNNKNYVSVFFTRLWFVCKLQLFDTQNPENSGFTTAHAYKY